MSGFVPRATDRQIGLNTKGINYSIDTKLQCSLISQNMQQFKTSSSKQKELLTIIIIYNVKTCKINDFVKLVDTIFLCWNKNVILELLKFETWF